MSESCGECKFWDEVGARPRAAEQRIGRCRRNAPMVMSPPGLDRLGKHHQGSQVNWPTCHDDDWCGDFKKALPDP